MSPGNDITVHRDPNTQLFECPCGNIEHARYSYHMFAHIFKHEPHPSGPAPAAYNDVPDSDVGTERMGVEAVAIASHGSEGCDMVVDASNAGVDATTVDNDDSYAMSTETVEDLLNCEHAPPNHTYPPTEFITSCHDSSERLLQLGIRVDPTHRLTICLDCGIIVDHVQIYRHKKNKHPASQGTYARRALPPKEELMQWLIQLGADRPVPILHGPVSAIEGVLIGYDGLKCGVLGCTSRRVFRDARRFNEHCAVEHRSIHVKNRCYTTVPYHQIGVLHSEMVLVEVLEGSINPISPELADIMSHASQIGLYAMNSTYSKPSNLRSRGALFSQTNWERCIESVDLKVLRPTAFAPNKSTEPFLVKLVETTRAYYRDIANNLDTLSILTLRLIASPNMSDNVESAPFRRPQQDSTLERYSDCMARFLIFLMRHFHSPVDGFHVPFHSQHITSINALYLTLVDRSDDSCIQDCINTLHTFIFSLLSFTSDQFLQYEWKDLLTLFLVVYHLTDDYGNTSHASQVPPTISAIQWCFRATGAQETKRLMQFNNGNSFQ
jgi:hypothetical protein